MTRPENVVKAEALREAADVYPDTTVGGEQESYLRARRWLRDRADRLATDTAAPEGVRDRAWAERFLAAWAKPYFGDDSRDAVAAVLRADRAADLTPVAPVAVEGVAPVEACPSDGQSVEWHRQQDPSGRTNGEFIGCDWGRGHIWMPPHHLVGPDLGMRCTECGGFTATTAPCIAGRWAALSPVEPETSEPEGGDR